MVNETCWDLFPKYSNFQMLYYLLLLMGAEDDISKFFCMVGGYLKIFIYSLLSTIWLLPEKF